MEAIERADLITVGPGSLYTSLITNLLVEGIPTALANASAGLRVFVCNLMIAGEREPESHRFRTY